jgi:two-component system alkaline phosphatase synthesis response regulator PhoP
MVIIDAVHREGDTPEICRAIRKLKRRHSIIVLTARDAADKIAALDAGADDCLELPCNPHELTARIRALLRRAQAVPGPHSYTVGGMEVDPLRRTVHLGLRSMDLRLREFDLLVELARRPGTVVPRTALRERVWGNTDPGPRSTLETHVCRLRRKLKESGNGTWSIETIKGVGYRLHQAPTEAHALQSPGGTL